MLALSIRQPFAELILRGIKTVEYRSRQTRIVGERSYIHASKGTQARRGFWSYDLSTTRDPPPWLTELAKELILDQLPRGVIVGSAVIEKVTRGEQFYEWHLAEVERTKKLRKPKCHPQPVWFRPF